MVTLGSGGAGRAFSCADPELCGQVRSSAGVRAAGAGGQAGGRPPVGRAPVGWAWLRPVRPPARPPARPQRPPLCPQLPPPPPSSRWAPRTGRSATSTSRSTGNRVSRGRPRVAECAAGPTGGGEERADGLPQPRRCVSPGVQPDWLALRSCRGHEPVTRLQFSSRVFAQDFVLRVQNDSYVL